MTLDLTYLLSIACAFIGGAFVHRGVHMAQRETLRRALDLALARLVHYGVHAHDCPTEFGRNACACGFGAALASLAVSRAVLRVPHDEVVSDPLYRERAAREAERARARVAAPATMPHPRGRGTYREMTAAESAHVHPFVRGIAQEHDRDDAPGLDTMGDA